MSKFMVIGEYGSYVIEAETWEDAFWKGYDSLKEEHLVGIIRISEEE